MDKRLSKSLPETQIALARRPAGLKDVAKLARVNVGTVSRVLNRSKGVEKFGEACIQRVEAAARSLNYQVNYHARSMKIGRSNAIGMALTRATTTSFDYFTAAMTAGVDSAVLTQSYHYVSVASTPEQSPVDTGLVFLQERRIDGLIVLGYGLLPAELAKLEATPKPIVLVEYYKKTSLPVVNLDDGKGVKKAVAHLAALGHKRLLWAGLTNRNDFHATRRHSAFQAETRKRQLTTTELIVPRAPRPQPDTAMEIEEARNAMLEFMSHQDSFTGIVCFDDGVALGVCSALRTLGKPIPTEYSVVGFDDIYANTVYPPLTTVRFMFREIGMASVQQISEMCETQSGWQKSRDQRLSIVPELVVRKSTAVPRPLSKM